MTPRQSSIRPPAATLLIAAALLLAGYAATAYVRLALHHDSLFGLVPLLDLGLAWAAPAWFIAGLLALNALLLLQTGREDPELPSGATPFLAGLLLLLAVDEVGRFHVLLDPLVRASSAQLARLSYGWMLPVSAVLLACLPLFRPVARRLPGPARRQLHAAAAPYFFGLLGSEALRSWYFAARHTSTDAGFALLTALGGGCRMAGLVLLARVLAATGPDDTVPSLRESQFPPRWPSPSEGGRRGSGAAAPWPTSSTS